MKFLDSKGLEYFYNKLKSKFVSSDEDNLFNSINTFRNAAAKSEQVSSLNTRCSCDVAFCDIHNTSSDIGVSPSLLFIPATVPNSARCCVLIIVGAGAPTLHWENCYLLCDAPTKEANKTLIVTVLITNDGAENKCYVVSSASGEEI